MLTRVVIEGFKNFRRVDLATGRMNLFIGPNGAGKSNFLDALRVLQGVGNGFTVGEVLDGKPRRRDARGLGRHPRGKRQGLS